MLSAPTLPRLTALLAVIMPNFGSPQAVEKVWWYTRLNKYSRRQRAAGRDPRVLQGTEARQNVTRVNLF